MTDVVITADTPEELEEKLAAAIKKEVDDVLNRLTSKIFTLSQENLVRPMPFIPKNRPPRSSIISDKADLMRSGKLDLTHFMEKRITYDAPYADDIELGTSPHYPPYNVILSWVQRKLGKTGKNAEDIANRICWNIYHYGTDPHPYLRPAIEEALVDF